MGRWSDDSACLVHDVRLYSVSNTVVKIFVVVWGVGCVVVTPDIYSPLSPCVKPLETNTQAFKPIHTVAVNKLIDRKQNNPFLDDRPPPISYNLVTVTS